jgi:hypothetical protein
LEQERELELEQEREQERELERERELELEREQERELEREREPERELELERERERELEREREQERELELEQEREREQELEREREREREARMIKLYKLDDSTTNLVFYSSERNEIAGYEHSETTVSEGFYLTAEELEQREREAFGAGRAMYYQKGEIGPFIQTYYQFIDADDYLKQRKES